MDRRANYVGRKHNDSLVFHLISYIHDELQPSLLGVMSDQMNR